MPTISKIQIQVLYHAPDCDQLLEVLFPEDGDMGFDGIEKLGADGRHAPKVTRSRQPTEVIGHPFDGNIGLIVWRVHLLIGGMIDHIDTHTLGHGPVSFKVPRILLEILMGAELGGVHIDADDNAVAPLAAFPHEIEVTFVKVSHGRHKRYDFSLISQGFR